MQQVELRQGGGALQQGKKWALTAPRDVAGLTGLEKGAAGTVLSLGRCPRVRKGSRVWL